MKKSEPKQELQLTIQLLEERCRKEGAELKQNILIAYESIKPINILKEAVKDLKGSNGVKNEISGLAIGAASGYLVRNVLFGFTRNPIVKLAGIVMQTLVGNIASRNSEEIVAFGSKVLESISSKSKSDKHVFSESEMYE